MNPKRPRRRYLAVRVLGEASFSGDDLLWAVQGTLLELYGEHGLSRAALRFMEFNGQRGEGILICNHSCVPQVRSALAAVREVARRPVILYVVGVSGTVRRLRGKFLERAHPKGIRRA